MSIVESNKQLYRADLENLIHSLTGFDSDSEEFQRCLDQIWPLFSRRYPSTSGQDVKEKLLSFSDKFIFHGFPQKAKNVKTLTEVYEKSEYFNEAKWDIVRVLLDLSYRPTDDFKDQDPVDLVALASEGEDQNVAPAFNWGEYLKQGWENFVLPDEESSLDLSISDSSFIDTEPPTIFEIPRPPLNIPDDKDEELNILRRKQKYTDLLSTHKQPEWWNIPNFRDKPRKELYTGRIRPEETFCYNWERIMFNGNQTNLVVTSEYKMIRLLLWILGVPPNTTSPRIKVNNKMYFIKDNVSITNLMPPTFKNSVQTRFLTPLQNLKVIIDFIEKVNSYKLLSQMVPNTYIMYANALDSIVTIYRNQLKNIEDDIKKQDSLCSLRRLYVALRTKEAHWNEIFEFIVSVHNKGVYPDFENVKNWLCSIKLLSVLYDQLETSVNYKKTVILKLFIESFSSYLEIICLMMAGNFDSDVKQEFVICRNSDKNNRILEIRNYYGFVKSFQSGSWDFWKPFISSCHRAISSVYFLQKLKKSYNLSKMISYDFFVEEFSRRLRSALSDFLPTEKSDELNSSNCLAVFSEDYVDDFVKTWSFCPQTRMFGDSFDSIFNVFRNPSKNIFKKSTLQKLSDDVLNAKLDVNMTNSVLKDVSVQMIKDLMLPAGFASYILLDELKLLEVLRNIRNIYFLNIIQPFSIELFHQIKENQHWNYPWTRKLRNCLNEFHPIEFCDQFNFDIGDSKIESLIGSSNVLSTLEYVKLNYYPEDFSMVFTDDIIEAYNHLFRFRLQLRYSYCLLLEIRLKDMKENGQNYEICRSLYSLKMWLLHTMTALYNYFVFIDEKWFDDKMMKACAEAKDLYTIQNAHMTLILEYKKQCFLYGKGCRKDPVLMIFRLCEELSNLWCSCAEGTLTENTIKSLEQKYLTSIESLASMLLNISSPGNFNFGILFNDIVNNMAVHNT